MMQKAVAALERSGESLRWLEKGKDRQVISGGDEGANELALRVAQCKERMRGSSSTTAGSNVQDAGALSSSVRARMETKVRCGAVKCFEGFVGFMKKCFGAHSKRRDVLAASAEINCSSGTRWR